MDSEFYKRLVDYFTTAELVELLNVDGSELIDALFDWNESLFDEDTLADLEEIMEHGGK
jgi:hypothetical protein